jgi:hypothetical protein
VLRDVRLKRRRDTAPEAVRAPISWSRGTKDERGEAAYLDQVGGSFTKRCARMALFIVNAR